MKNLFKFIIGSVSLFFFSSVQADTIKWLHLTGESSPEYPNFVRAVEEFEAKTGERYEFRIAIQNLGNILEVIKPKMKSKRIFKVL